MTELTYLNDSYLKEAEAVVIKAEGKFIVLDRTVFYPQGGGQPSDTGKLISGNGEGYKVVFAKKIDDGVSHEVDREGLKAGEKVRCVLDWERRYKLMRAHTAAHVVSGLIAKELNALITGNQLEEDKTRIDFSLESFDKELMERYLQKANELIEKDLPLKIYSKPREEAEKIPEISKLSMGLPQGIKDIRIVEIVGFDLQADGGTHVKSLKEIGKLKLLKCENKGKTNRRIYFTLEQ